MKETAWSGADKPEEGVIVPTLGGLLIVQVPFCFQPLYMPASSRTYRYVFLAPVNVGLKVMFQFMVNVVPDPETVV